MIATVFLVVIASVFSSFNLLTNRSSISFSYFSDAPPHFYYQGNVYICRGPGIEQLPKEAILLGKADNVGDVFSGRDFEGNVDGLIYMDLEDKSIAYLQWNGMGEPIIEEEFAVFCQK